METCRTDAVFGQKAGTIIGLSPLNRIGACNDGTQGTAQGRSLLWCGYWWVGHSWKCFGQCQMTPTRPTCYARNEAHSALRAQASVPHNDAVVSGQAGKINYSVIARELATVAI